MKRDASRGSDKASPSTSRGKALLRYVAKIAKRVYKFYTEPAVYPFPVEIDFRAMEESVHTLRRHIDWLLWNSDSQFLRALYVEPLDVKDRNHKLLLDSITELKYAAHDLIRCKTQVGRLSLGESIASQRRLKLEVKELRRLARKNCR